MWQHASSRLALNLVPYRLLARPFAPISTTILHIKHLHDDKKKPVPNLAKELKDLPADDQLKLGGQIPAADSKSAPEQAGLESLGNDVETTAVQKGKKLIFDAQRTASYANLQRGRETQRAAGYPALRRGRETQRSNGFPALHRGRETQRANGILVLGLETQRAAGFPILKEFREAQQYHAEQRADLGKSRHSNLLRDIEAVNKRKLAEDPTFVPSPLPGFESMSRIVHRKYSRTIPCPEPGCKSKLSNERTLATHILRKHTYSRYSIDTPHKCKDPSCNKYFPTTKEALKHYSAIHGRQKPTCPVCDRIFSSPSVWKRHLLLMHGIPFSSASVSP